MVGQTRFRRDRIKTKFTKSLKRPDTVESHDRNHAEAIRHIQEIEENKTHPFAILHLLFLCIC